MQGKASLRDDEIDLRGLVRSLLQYKWWILGITLVVALAAYGYTKFYAGGKIYQARALLVFGQPILNITNPGTITAGTAAVGLTSLPDSKGITDLASMDDVLYEVYQAPELADSRSKGLTFGRLKGGMNASLSGTNQLLLQVKSSDAKQSAQIANLWAQSLADRINSLYGASNAQVAALETQTQDAQQAWDASDKALADALQQSNADALAAQVSQAQAGYNAQAGRLQGIDLVLSDARALDARLAALAPDSALTTGDALSLLELKSRVGIVLLCPVEFLSPTALPAGGEIPPVDPSTACTSYSGLQGVQLQISPQDLAGGQSAAAARQELKAFTDSLQTQQTELKTALEQAQKQLGALHSQLESAQSQIDRLTTERDVARTTYQTVSTELASTRIEVAANGEVVRIAGKALPPGAPLASRSGLTALAAALVAFILACMGAIVVAWWTAPAESTGSQGRGG